MLKSDVIIVLSRPSEAGNIGAVCRVMKNMGLSRLRLCAPDLSLEPAALSDSGSACGGNEDVIRTRAVHAFDIWEKAETFDSLSEAVKDCALVIGTTARRGRLRKQTMTPAETAAFLKQHPGPAALVFGNERAGLDREEIDLCNFASHIPAQAPKISEIPKKSYKSAFHNSSMALRVAAMEPPASPATMILLIARSFAGSMPPFFAVSPRYHA